FSGGMSPSQWRISLNFGNLQDNTGAQIPASALTNVRKIRWTWAADIQQSNFVRSEFSVVVTNWTVTGTRLAYQVAGPGSFRVEDDDTSLTYTQPTPLPQGTSGWTETTGNFSGGSIHSVTAPEAQVSCTYTATFPHTLYLGTRGAPNCTTVSAVVDGGAAQTSFLGISDDVLLRINIGSFAPGNHTVSVKHAGKAGEYFYFDFFEIALTTETLPSFPANPQLTLATDWDTLHAQALAPERTAWLINSLGFQGRANHYAGALWFYELSQPGQSYAALTVTFSGNPVWSHYTYLVFGTGSQATTLTHLNLIGDTAESIATCFALLINAGSTAVWAEANGAVLQITARTMGSAGNGLAVAANTSGDTAFTATATGPALAGGVDQAAEGPAGVVWRTDLAAMPRMNRAFRDWNLAFFKAMAGYGIPVTTAFSTELGNADDSAATGIAQRYPNGSACWVSTPAVQTNFSSVSLAYWQQVHLDMAQLMANGGLPPSLQFGEVQWWYFCPPVNPPTNWSPTANNGMPFYDAYTTTQFQSQYSAPMHVFQDPSDDPSAYANERAFLPGLIGAFTSAITSFVKASVASAKFEVLYPPDTNDSKLMRVMNLPSAWTPANLDFFKTENFTYLFERDLNKIQASIALPASLGFAPTACAHLVGMSDVRAPWDASRRMAAALGYNVVLFALDQVCLIGYPLPLPPSPSRSLRMG
ncbi:MAG: hypothetical protein JO323_03150, partial [Acidobacteriia bacterium]|nr:hypothetical protein [Terriglobia bacterium]